MAGRRRISLNWGREAGTVCVGQDAPFPRLSGVPVREHQIMKRRQFLAVGAGLLLASAQPASAQQVVSIASNPQGSIFYIASVAIAKVTNDKLKW
jgi:hypothetical protein